MGVAVQYSINTGDIVDHIDGGVGLAADFGAQVTADDDVLRTFRAGSVHGGLNGRVELRTGIILAEAVHEVAVFILEVGRSGRGNGLGGGHADEGDLHALKLLDDVGIEDELVLIVEVGRHVGVLCHFAGQGQEVGHAVVELMVAGHSHVVANHVHQFNKSLAVGQGADGFALDGVAIVHQDNMVLGSHRIADRSHASVAPALIDTSMDVTGEQDDDVLGQTGGSFLRHCSTAQHHHDGQKQCKELFHCEFLLIRL